MQTVTRSAFVTVHTEGGLLPSDLLARLVDHELDGLSPADYGLAANIRLSEEISRAWAACQAAWSRFQQERAALPADDTSATGTTLTRERWLLPLLAALGYGAGDPFDRLRFVGTLTADNGSSYPISHAAGRLPVHLVTFRQELDRRSPVETALRRSPHAIMQEFLNRADGYRWGLISNGLRLRLLRDNAALTRKPMSSSISRACSRASSMPTLACSGWPATARGPRATIPPPFGWSAGTKRPPPAALAPWIACALASSGPSWPWAWVFYSAVMASPSIKRCWPACAAASSAARITTGNCCVWSIA
jgi:hypothetical protein